MDERRKTHANGKTEHDYKKDTRFSPYAFLTKRLSVPSDTNEVSLPVRLAGNFLALTNELTSHADSHLSRGKTVLLFRVGFVNNAARRREK